ncbi:MAG TPA: hypothetical protein VF238_11050 [Methylomirabilota bacterium]
MPKYTMEHGGKKYSFSSDAPLSDADLNAAAAQYFGPEKSKTGQVAQIAGEELVKTPGRMAEGISSMWESIKNPKMSTTLPMTLGPVGKAVPGAIGLAKLGAGEIGTGILSGIGRGLSRATTQGLGRGLDAPPGQKISEGVKGGGIALAWEAALGGLAGPMGKVPFMTKSLKEVAAPLKGREKAFAGAGEAPMKAYEALKDSVPKNAWMEVPSISKTPITFKEASEKLGKLEGVDFQAARNEIFKELERGGPSGLMSGPALNPPVKASVALGGQAPKTPYAAEGFDIRVPKERFTPPSTEGERFAKGAVEGLKSPLARTAADIVASEEDQKGIPLGVYPLAPVAGSASSLMDFAKRWIPK